MIRWSDSDHQRTRDQNGLLSRQRVGWFDSSDNVTCVKKRQHSEQTRSKLTDVTVYEVPHWDHSYPFPLSKLALKCALWWFESNHSPKAQNRAKSCSTSPIAESQLWGLQYRGTGSKSLPISKISVIVSILRNSAAWAEKNRAEVNWPTLIGLTSEMTRGRSLEKFRGGWCAYHQRLYR